VIDMIVRIVLAACFFLGSAGGASLGAKPSVLSTEYSVLSTAFDVDPAKPAQKKPPASLDDEVLKGLGLDPALDDLTPGQSEKKEDKKQQPENELDKQLLEGLMEGEDIGTPGDPLVRIGRRMRQAGELIGQNKSDEPTQTLQKRILEDIEKLIKQARQQQQQQQQQNSSSQQNSKREMVRQSQPSTQSKQSASEPGQQSTERQGKNDVRRPDPSQVNDMIKSIWGQLPGRAKEEMLWNANDEFLPKYELLIEEYFKSLVERQQRGK
jgi:hypothetical protein